jgi:hypothetical protein
MKTGGDYDVRINRKRNKQSEDPMRLPGWRKSWTKCSIVPHAGARIYSLIRDNENSIGNTGELLEEGQREPPKKPREVAI